MIDCVEEKALARNMRYLVEVVEEFGFCPFARRCRESGALERRVLITESFNVADLTETVADLHKPRFDHVEIGLLIFPLLKIAPADFERATAKLREATKTAGYDKFFIVAFHPDVPFDASAPERLVPLFRRSPDPTLQLVRVTTLDRARKDAPGTVWMNLKNVDLRNPPPPPPPGLSESIAQTNYDTVRAQTPERIASLLEEIRNDRK